MQHDRRRFCPADLYRDEHGSGGDVLLGYFRGQGHIVNRLLRFDGRIPDSNGISERDQQHHERALDHAVHDKWTCAGNRAGWQRSNPVTRISPGSSAFYDCTYFTGATDAEAFCFGGGYAHYYNATTSAINWAWQMNNSPGGTSYNASSIALEAAPAGSGHCAACDMSFLEQR